MKGYTTLEAANATRLALLEYAAFIERQLTDLEALAMSRSGELTDPNYLLFLKKLKEAFEKFGPALVKVRAHIATVMLKEDDSIRDTDLLNFWEFLGIQARNTDKVFQVAANNINTLKPAYRSLGSKSYEAQSVGTDNLLIDLLSETYAGSVIVLGLQPYIDKIGQSNESFKAKIGYRQQNIAQTDKVSSKDLRDELHEVYTHFSNYLAAMAFLQPDSAWSKALDTLNLSRKYYSALVQRRIALAAKAKAAGEVPEDVELLES